MTQDTKPSGKFNLPFSVAAIIGGIFLGLFITRTADNAAADAAKMAVIDTDKIVQAKALSVKGANTEEVARGAEEFSRDLKSLILQLTQQGYVVLKSSQLVGWPQATDKTLEVASALNVDLALADSAVAEREQRVRDLLQQAQKSPQ